MSKSPLIHTPSKVIKPEDISLDDLKYLSKDSFALWALTSGAKVDSNDVEFENHRYLLPLYMDDSNEIVWQKAAQMGATIYMLLRILWWLYNHPGRKGGLYMPNKELIDNTSKDRLNPLIRSVPPIHEITNEGDKLGLKQVGTASFYLYHLGGVSSKDSVPLDYISFDEIRLCEDKDIDQALERISHSPFKQKVYMSTCFSGDTEVFVREKNTGFVTQKSIKNLQNCFKDYQVLSYNRLGGYRPRWRDITAVHNNGVKSVVKARFEGNHTLKCTPDHRFAVHDQDTALFGESVFKQITDIPTFKVGHTPAPVRPYSLLKVPAVEGSPYDLTTFEFLGLYIAEGSLSSAQKTTVSIWQSNKNLKNEAVRDLAKDWAVLQGLSYEEKEDGVHISGLHTRKDLRTLFMQCGGTASEKRVPITLLQGNEAQMRHLLHGFILGDGHVPVDGNREFDLYTTSEQLARDLQLVCFKLGKPCQVTKRKRYHDVYIDSVRTGKPNYSEIRLTFNKKSHRNQELLRGLGGAALLDIEPCGEEEVFDLTVDKDSWYFIAGSGVLAHNCGLPDRDINMRFQEGSQHIWMARCGCESGCDLARTFPDCVVADDPRRDEPYLRCPKCKWEIKDPQNGRYIAHNPGADYHSYHVSQLTSKFISLKEIWKFWKRTTNIAEFYNAKLGLPYIDEENRGVTMNQLESAIDPYLEWAKPNKRENSTAMGVDQGGGYLMVTIADLKDNKKRLRHVEIIEQHNPDYKGVNGQLQSPFKRLGELMDEYGVRVCVVDAMPNVNDALQFAQRFPGRVFLAYYQKDAKEIVQWGDRKKYKETIRKAGPLLKFKYLCILSRFSSIDFSLGEWAIGNVVCPDPEKLRQMAFDEKTSQLMPEAPARRVFSHLVRLIKRFHVTDEDTGEGRWEWIYTGGDPHLAHAWNYCNVALERLRRVPIYTFA